MSEVYVRVPMYQTPAVLGGVYAALLAAGSCQPIRTLLWAHALFVCIGTACGLFAHTHSTWRRPASYGYYRRSARTMHPKPVQIGSFAPLCSPSGWCLQLVSFSIEHKVTLGVPKRRTSENAVLLPTAMLGSGGIGQDS